MTNLKEPELFLLRKSEDKETHSWLYELMKNVKKETITHFNDPELNTFFHQEQRQKESLYKYVVIRHMLDESEWVEEDVAKEDNKATEDVKLESNNVMPFPSMFNFNNIIPSNYANIAKKNKLDIDRKRNLLTGKECQSFKSKNALYFIVHDEHSIEDIISSIK